MPAALPRAALKLVVWTQFWLSAVRPLALPQTAPFSELRKWFLLFLPILFKYFQGKDIKKAKRDRKTEREHATSAGSFPKRLATASAGQGSEPEARHSIQIPKAHNSQSWARVRCKSQVLRLGP